MFRLILTERARPGCLLVNGRGRRFVDEAQNYNDLGRALQNFEPTSFSFPNVPAWLIFNGEYRATYRLGPLSRRDPDPDWLARGETPAELGAAIGVPGVGSPRPSPASTRAPPLGPIPISAAAASPTTASSAISGRWSRRRTTPSRCCLGASARRAVQTDADGRVLSITDGNPIPGLYAAGNAAASPLELACPAPSRTIGPAGIVFGLRAGEAAAGD